MSDLEGSIWQRYRDQGVQIYAIHPGDDPGLVQDFVEQTGISYCVVRDQGTRNLFAYPPGGGYPYPRDVVVGRDKVVRSIKNSFNVDEVDALVQQLLDE